MVAFDSFTILERMATGFEQFCQSLMADRSDLWANRGLAFSRQGFFLLFPGEPFEENISVQIRHRLEGELSKESLEWYEEAECVAFFSCYTLGGTMGQHHFHLLSDAEFRLIDAQLPGFLAIHAARLYDAYEKTKHEF